MVEAPGYSTGGLLGGRKRREVLSRKFTRGKRRAHGLLEEGESNRLSKSQNNYISMLLSLKQVISRPRK